LAVRDELRRVILDMHHEPHGRAVLAGGRVRQYVAVADADYDPIRRMAVAGARVRL
jgi:ABC-type phosphate/phosphonate transport system substrate-binding protein